MTATKPKYRLVAFELSMPSRNSWNGKWSGEDKRYVLVRRTRKEEIADTSFYYDFGDGWGARVRTFTVTGEAARKLRRVSAGFCGYDWMVDSILAHGRIQA